MLASGAALRQYRWQPASRWLTARHGTARHGRSGDGAVRDRNHANFPETGMTNEWLYQLRLDVSDALASSLRGDAAASAHPALHAVLQQYGATLVCQFDAFAGYVREAEQHGPDGYPLYRWTRATVEDPEKRARYLRSFTVYVGGEQVYGREIADALEAQLRALAEPRAILSISKFDTNPANSPQPPA